LDVLAYEFALEWVAAASPLAKRIPVNYFPEAVTLKVPKWIFWVNGSTRRTVVSEEAR
jgi:hypothetical protein